MRLRPLLVLLFLGVAGRAVAGQAVTVGHGTPESCSEFAVRTAVDSARAIGAERVLFDCGPDPLTIVFHQPEYDELVGPYFLRIPDHTRIDGGGLITFTYDGPDVRHIVFVESGMKGAIANVTFQVPRAWSSWDQLDLGAALVVNDGTLSIENCTFDGYATAIDNRGALRIDHSTVQFTRSLHGAIVNQRVLEMANSLVEFNASATSAVVNYSGATASIASSTFWGNTTGSMGGWWGGGGAVLNLGALTIGDSTFVANTAGDYFGGAVRSFGTSLTIRRSVFRDNFAYGYGGALLTESNTEVDDTTFEENEVGHNGGALSILSPDGGPAIHVVIKRSRFRSNLGRHGAGLYSDGADLRITNSTFDGNIGRAWDGSFGGGLHVRGGNLVLSNSTVTGNCDWDAGGIYFEGPSGAFTIQGRTDISNNSPNDVVIRQQ